MKTKLLICDDEENILESIKLVLEDTYTLVFAKNGEQALKCFENIKDIKGVLLDIKMPLTNGLDLLVSIKSKFPHIKVIMVSGYVSPTITTKIYNLGASGLVVKPFHSKKLKEIVQSIFPL